MPGGHLPRNLPTISVEPTRLLPILRAEQRIWSEKLSCLGGCLSTLSETVQFRRREAWGDAVNPNLAFELVGEGGNVGVGGSLGGVVGYDMEPAGEFWL